MATSFEAMGVVEEVCIDEECECLFGQAEESEGLCAQELGPSEVFGVALG